MTVDGAWIAGEADTQGVVVQGLFKLLDPLVHANVEDDQDQKWAQNLPSERERNGKMQMAPHCCTYT